MTVASQELERGRRAYAARAWAEARAALTAADADGGLAVEDLERLATTATMLGLETERVALSERVYQARLGAQEPRAAARAAFWIGMHAFLRADMGHGMAWLGRAQRLLEGHGECVEHGYLLMPNAFRLEGMGELAQAAEIAARAAAIGDRYGEPDLVALASAERGNLLVRLGRMEEGLALLDEAMLTATEGRLSPFVTGVVYCAVILACHEARDPRRAREWTAALARWCEAQPDLVAFTGRCLVHRAEIMQLDGAWPDALQEARRGVPRCLAANNRRAAGEAAYVQGEIHRVRGAFDAAESAFREAGGYGREPLPGLAVLRLNQGRVAAAVACIRRALAETTDASARARLYPAAVEILLTAGEAGEAAAAADELDAYRREHPGPMLAAIADQARGAIELAEGDATAALRALRTAWRGWDDLDAPYEAARTRVLIARACRALGDEEAAALEAEAARATFERLGAAPDLAALAGASKGGLSPRELEVLRLVAAGRTNKAIAVELVVSDRTVDRHVANIFTKLGVSSRAAATARAYELDLL